VVFLWFRPQGVLPERRRRIGAGSPLKPVEIPNEDVVTLAGSLRAPGLADATRQDGAAVRVAGRPITRSVPSSAEADGGVVLRTVDVARDFGGVHAVAGVSIEVRRGTLTGLIGPNGAGKSTLLAMLAGTMPVTSGQVTSSGVMPMNRVPSPVLLRSSCLPLNRAVRGTVQCPGTTRGEPTGAPRRRG
jgi:branched-chain amino acid transport system permease protein